MLKFPEKNENYMAMKMRDRGGHWDGKSISGTQILRKGRGTEEQAVGLMCVFTDL